jgi:hypothetical protein
MFTGGLGMIGSIYDFITLPGQVQEANIRSAIYGNMYRNRPKDHQFGGVGSGRRNPETESWRYVDDGEIRVVHEKESIEKTILRLAKQNKGVLTAHEVALGSNISLDDAKKALDTLVNKGFAELRVRKSGTLVYVLPEFRDQDDALEDF